MFNKQTSVVLRAIQSKVGRDNSRRGHNSISLFTRQNVNFKYSTESSRFHFNFLFFGGGGGRQFYKIDLLVKTELSESGK